MKNHNENRDYLTELIEKLNEENLSEIDFDKLQIWLNNQEEHLAAVISLNVELESLRADYTARIGGMVKATAVADRRLGAVGEGVKLLDNINQLPSAELVSLYNKVSARFRDTFPGSPHSPMTRRSSTGRTARIRDYK